MSTMIRSKSGREQRDAILEQLLDSALTGKAPWQKEWTGPDFDLLAPRNATTHQKYTGSNALWLWLAQLERGVDDGRWVTYRQAETQGWQVRAGAKSVQLVKVGTGQARDDVDENGDPRTYSFLRTFNVFHASDVEGIPELAAGPLPAAPVSASVPESVLSIIEAGPAVVQWRTLPAGESPSYSLWFDTITLPKPEQFSTQQGLVATALHELAHWTGHRDREARPQDGTFGSVRYAAEELVADTAAFLAAAELGLPSSPQNTGAYLRSWSQGDREKLRAALPAAISAANALTGLAAGKRPSKWKAASEGAADAA